MARGRVRVTSALLLAITALLISVAFTGVQLACGYRSTSAESVAPGETPVAVGATAIACLGLLPSGPFDGLRREVPWPQVALALVTLGLVLARLPWPALVAAVATAIAMALEVDLYGLADTSPPNVASLRTFATLPALFLVAAAIAGIHEKRRRSVPG